MPPKKSDTPPPFVDADVPLDSAEAERLGRLEFVRLLARRVLAYRGQRALVVGVCGPWGSGKTSLVNLLVKEIEECRSEKGSTVLPPVKFTPWALGARDDLAQDLLREIGRMVRDRAGAQAVALDIGTHIAEVGTALAVAGVANHAGTPTWLSGALAAIGLSGKVKEGLSRLARPRVAPSIQQAAERVASKLREKNALLVVALDDLERLPADQIQAVFRVVSAIADFPNTVYILAMDRHRVAKALDDEYGDGHAYLEKFLNLTFDVPSPDVELLGELFVERLKGILTARDAEVDQRRLSEVWHLGLKKLIQNPRDIVRVMNSFDMALDAIAHESDAVDLLALETLRVLEPRVHLELSARPYGVLRQTRDWAELVGLHGEAMKSKRQEDDLRAILEKASPAGREHVRSLLGVVFPAVGHGRHAGDHPLHRAKRAASPDHYDHYFRWSLASGALSTVAMHRAIEELVAAKTDEQLTAWFDAHEPRFIHFAEKLLHYLDEIEAKDRRYDLAAALLRVGHLLEDRSGPLPRSKHMTAEILAYHLIKSHADGWDRELLSRCGETTWLFGLAAMLAMQCRDDPRNRFDEFASPSPDSRRVLGEALSLNFEAGEYDDHPSLASFVYRWRDVLGADGPPREWVAKKVAARHALVWSIIDHLLNLTPLAGSLGDQHRSLNRQNLEGLFDLDQLRAYVAAVPHPRDSGVIVAATLRTLDAGSSG